MAFTLRLGVDDEARPREPAHELRGRVLLVIEDTGELDALSEELVSHFSFDVIPVSTIQGARMELVSRTYEVVVVDSASGLSWLNELNPEITVMVLGSPKRSAPRDGWVVVEEWPSSVAELAAALETAIEGGGQLYASV